MKIKKIALWVLLSSLLAPVAAAQPPGDVLASLPDDRLDLELKQVGVDDLFLMLGSIWQVKFEVSGCVSGKVSLKLQSVTGRTVLQTIGDSLGLRYSAGDDDSILVDCVPLTDTDTDARIDFEAADLPLADVLSLLGEADGVRVESESCDGLRVDLRVAHASPQTVLNEVVAQAGATLEDRDGHALVRCGDA